MSGRARIEHRRARVVPGQVDGLLPPHVHALDERGEVEGDDATTDGENSAIDENVMPSKGYDWRYIVT